VFTVPSQPRPKRKRKTLFIYEDEDSDGYDFGEEAVIPSRPPRESAPVVRRIPVGESASAHANSVLNDKRKFMKDWSDFHLNR
jgi:hypothetical protein